MAEWTQDKAKRIARYTKRLNQLDEYLDHWNEQEHDDGHPYKPDGTAIKLEADILRRIAEEQGDIPRATTTPDPTEPLDILVSGEIWEHT